MRFPPLPVTLAAAATVVVTAAYVAQPQLSSLFFNSTPSSVDERDGFCPDDYPLDPDCPEDAITEEELRDLLADQLATRTEEIRELLEQATGEEVEESRFDPEDDAYVLILGGGDAVIVPATETRAEQLLRSVSGSWGLTSLQMMQFGDNDHIIYSPLLGATLTIDAGEYAWSWRTGRYDQEVCRFVFGQGNIARSPIVETQEAFLPAFRDFTDICNVTQCQFDTTPIEQGRVHAVHRPDGDLSEVHIKFEPLVAQNIAPSCSVGLTMRDGSQPYTFNFPIAPLATSVEEDWFGSWTVANVGNTLYLMHSASTTLDGPRGGQPATVMVFERI